MSGSQKESAFRFELPWRATLTRRILAWTLGALLVVWLTFIAAGYQAGIHEADELTDGHLASVAALLLNVGPDAFLDNTELTPRIALPHLRKHDYQQSLTVGLWSRSGALLGHLGDGPLPTFRSDEGYADLRLPASGTEGRETRWRSFAQWDATGSRRVLVMIALNERNDLAADIAGQVLAPGLWLLPVIALALGFAIWRGLRPLYALSRDVARLDVDRAQKLPARHALREFESVVGSINHLVDRHSAALARERRLASEIAHELRTPLASMALHARALQKPLAEAERQRALDQIAADALRAGHVLDQLLALARTSRAGLHETRKSFDLVELARQTVVEHAQLAWERRDELALTGLAQLAMSGHPGLVTIALRNLVTNAIAHTPPGTAIEVEIGRDGPPGDPAASCWIQVCDNGRSVAASPEPVTRAGANEGLRLGHVIVARVAEVHGGRFGELAAHHPMTTCFRIDLGPAEAFT